jgi:hypothetical protein
MGAKFYWTVEVENTPGGSYSTVNAQTLSFTFGRSEVTNDFPAGQVNISGIDPDSLPAAFGKINSVVRLRLYSNNGTLRLTRYCYARSLTRSYGVIAALDTWTFNGVGELVRLGEQQLTSDYTLTAGMDTGQAFGNLVASYGIGATYQTGLSFVSATTFTTGTFLNDIVQTIVRTEQGRLRDGDLGISFLARGSFINPATPVIFTDGTVAGSPNSTYMNLDFVNDGQYFANTVIVSAEGFADQIVGSSRPVLNFNSVDVSTSQAANLAQYIKNTLDVNLVRPTSIRFNLDAQASLNFVDALQVGTQIRIDLRGVSYPCVVESVSISANPSTTDATLIVSSADAYRFLILDNSVFGKLDENKLGF